MKKINFFCHKHPSSIVYIIKGYLFEFMSNHPEEVIINYIHLSAVLEYGN